MAFPDYPPYPPFPPALPSYRGPFPPLTLRPPGPPSFPGYLLTPTPPMTLGFYQRYPVSAAYQTGIQQGRREGYGAAVEDLRGRERLGEFRGDSEQEQGSHGGSQWGARVEIDVGMGRLRLEDGREGSTRGSRDAESEGGSSRGEVSGSSRRIGGDGGSRAQRGATSPPRARDQNSTRIQTSMQARDPRSSASSNKPPSTINPGSSVSQRLERGSISSSRRSRRSGSTSTPGPFTFPDLSARSSRSSKRDPILENFACAKRNASPPPSRARSNRSAASKTHEHVWDERTQQYLFPSYSSPAPSRDSDKAYDSTGRRPRGRSPVITYPRSSRFSSPSRRGSDTSRSRYTRKGRSPGPSVQSSGVGDGLRERVDRKLSLWERR
ncbi:hypothetical protein B0A48_17814 [Cryoendolithus antarcticus]|uniref:Uncharacterized protein n=1 Tax=Cryoendolithus antarcticus TaxID=1507870 RepID=A0A1V8SAV3_9PEZI|nr:hypothetical protein B0A48_17814 [Cryoendolithus antarcticus]